MYKAMIKATVAVAFIMGITGSATAEDFKVSAFLRHYIGQYQSGVEGESAHIENYGQANVVFEGKKGKLSGKLDIEYRRNKDAGGLNQAPFRLDYDAGFGTIILGTFENPAAANFNVGGGTKTTDMPCAPALTFVHAGWTKDDGIGVKIPIGGLNLMVNLYGEAETIPVNAPAPRGNGGAEGQTVQAGIWGDVGPVKIKVSATSVTLDDYSEDTTADALTNNARLVGVKIPVGSMDFMIDSSNYKAGAETVAAEKEWNDMALGFAMKDLGPGKIRLTYESSDMKKGGEKFMSTIGTSLVYDIEFEKKVGFQIVYQSQAATPEATDETTTKSFTGVGMYGKF